MLVVSGHTEYSGPFFSLRKVRNEIWAFAARTETTCIPLELQYEVRKLSNENTILARRLPYYKNLLLECLRAGEELPSRWKRPVLPSSPRTRVFVIIPILGRAEGYPPRYGRSICSDLHFTLSIMWSLLCSTVIRMWLISATRMLLRLTKINWFFLCLCSPYCLINLWLEADVNIITDSYAFYWFYSTQVSIKSYCY